MDHVSLVRAQDAANRAASQAASVIEQYQSSGDWSVSFKSDDSPVTEVDVAVEESIRAILHEALPEASFFGEETGVRTGVRTGDRGGVRAADLCWLVDPIDGTKSFIRNMRYFSTQIALEVNGQLVLGVSNAPAYGERLVACSGAGVRLNDVHVRVRAGIDVLSEAFLSAGNLSTLAGEPERWRKYGQIVARVRRVRGYGDFCHYHQLCCGQTDLIIESDVNILDIAALTVAVREAGGIITDLEGQEIDRSSTSVLAAGSAVLHQHALEALN